MRIAHWEALQPVCPRCLHERGQVERLALADTLLWRTEGILMQGTIRCPSQDCAQEYPVIDGVPLLVPSVREYVQGFSSMILHRTDLPLQLESIVGDCLGPDDQFNLNRYYLSSYAHDAYLRQSDPDSVVSVLTHLLKLMSAQDPSEVMLDLGCGTGRTTFALAEQSPGLALGVDTNFSMARLAQNLMLDGRASFSRRKVGLVYERAHVASDFAGSDRVDFWVCDAQRLPFESEVADRIVALNLLDSVHSPATLISEIARVLGPQGCLGIAAPFDWSSHATPVENWIGGHSQRGELQGQPQETLKRLLAAAITGAFEVQEDDGVAWSTTTSDRGRIQYQEYLLALRRVASPP